MMRLLHVVHGHHWWQSGCVQRCEHLHCHLGLVSLLYESVVVLFVVVAAPVVVAADNVVEPIAVSTTIVVVAVLLLPVDEDALVLSPIGFICVTMG